MRTWIVVPALATALVVLASCSGGSSAPATSPTAARLPPAQTFQDFLRLPTATPSACPSTQNGTTVGRASPWVGTVDVSVFVRPHATTAQVHALGTYLRSDPQVQSAFFESQHQAYEEFQRLYTCWTSVPKDQAPASYRVLLFRTATLATRDLLVHRLIKQPVVDSVSCDPSVPCVNVVESTTPTPIASHTHRR
jgi:hypothetical protein